MCIASQQKKFSGLQGPANEDVNVKSWGPPASKYLELPSIWDVWGLCIAIERNVMQLNAWFCSWSFVGAMWMKVSSSCNPTTYSLPLSVESISRDVAEGYYVTICDGQDYRIHCGGAFDFGKQSSLKLILLIPKSSIIITWKILSTSSI